MKSIISRVLNKRYKAMLPFYLTIFVIAFLILALIFKFTATVRILKYVEKKLDEAVVSVATENWDQIYSGVRDGYSGGHKYYVTRFRESYSSGDVALRLNNYIGADEGVKYDDNGKIVLKMHDLITQIENVSFRAGNTLNFKVKSSVKVRVPFKIWKSNINIDVEVKAASKYTNKF